MKMKLKTTTMKMTAAKYLLMIFFSSFLILESNAKNSNLNATKAFSLYSSCLDSDCAIYSQHFDKIEIFDDKPGIHRIKKVDNDLYQIIYSCGNPCNNNVFINNKGLEDWTDRLVAHRGHCLIEYDLKNKRFTARTVFSNKSKVILKLDDNAYVSAIPIWFYSNNSYFDNDMLIINVKQKTGSNKKFRFANPCIFSK